MILQSAIPTCLRDSNLFYYLLLRADGSIVEANPLFSSHFMQMSEGSRSISELLVSESHLLFLEWLHGISRNRKQKFTGELQFKESGSRLFCELSFFKESGSGELVFECMGIALENILAQNAQPQSNEKRLETIVSNSIDLQLLIDASGTIFYCSPNIFETLGYTSEELTGKNGFSYVHPEDLDLAKNLFREEMTNPGKNQAADIRFLKKDGNWLWAEAKGRNLLMEPSVQGFLINLNDISARKLLEEELLLKENLRHKQIAQAAVDAQEKERADIGKELHDNISQMLTSTKLFLDILKNKQPDELLDRSVNNINAIIKEVRSLSRSLVPSSITDLGLVASLNDLLENIRMGSAIEIEFYPAAEEEMPLSPNSKLTLYRIAQEQINNIVRHSEAAQVFVELFPEDGHVELVIADNGKGFDPETVKPGMGLKNIRSRAELLNGKAQIISSPGNGCKLKVVIPLT